MEEKVRQGKGGRRGGVSSLIKEIAERIGSLFKNISNIAQLQNICVCIFVHSMKKDLFIISNI